MASHGGAGLSRGKQSLNRATVFLSFPVEKKYILRKPFKSIALPQLFADNAILITKTQIWMKSAKKPADIDRSVYLTQIVLSALNR